MSLIIKANTFATKRHVEVIAGMVIYYEAAFIGGKKKFPFGQVEHVLLSPAGVLSFQVGSEVFSIPTRSDNEVHRMAISALVQGVRNAHASTPAAYPAAGRSLS